MSRSYRFSKSSFDHFAPFIGAALKQWPRPFRVPLGTKKPTGFMQPCRDAIRAGLQQNFFHPEVDIALYQRHGKELCVFEQGEGVYLGPRPSRTKSLPVSFLPPDTYELTDHSFLGTLCNLVGSQALTPMPIFFARRVPPAVQADLSRRYEIAFVPVEGREELFQIV